MIGSDYANPKNENPDLELLTAIEAARLLKVHFSTVYEMMKSGEIATVKWGRSVRIRKVDLEEFITSHLENQE